jgi:hypothetical protein
MDKKRLEIIITSILIIVLIFAWLNSIKILNKKFKHNPKPQRFIEQPVTGMASIGLSKDAQAISAPKTNKWQEEESLDFLRSPFSGKRYGEESIDFKISGLIWDDVNPQVIINGQISKRGDSIEGFIIEKIEKYKVILSNGNKRIELNI